MTLSEAVGKMRECGNVGVATGKMRSKMRESKAFNSAMKRLQTWKEAPVDAVVLVCSLQIKPVSGRGDFMRTVRPW